MKLCHKYPARKRTLMKRFIRSGQKSRSRREQNALFFRRRHIDRRFAVYHLIHTYGSRAFAVSGPTFRNLITSVISEVTVAETRSFCKQLKTIGYSWRSRRDYVTRFVRREKLFINISFSFYMVFHLFRGSLQPVEIECLLINTVG